MVPLRLANLMAGAEQEGFFVGAVHFDALGLDVGVIFQGLMHDAAFEGAHGFEFDDVAPAADFVGGVLGFLDQGFAGLGAVAADIDGNLGRGFVLLKENAVGDVLEVGEGLALAADQLSGMIFTNVLRQSAFLPIDYTPEEYLAACVRMVAESIEARAAAGGRVARKAGAGK